MTVEDRRKHLASLIAAKAAERAAFWLVAQCDCGHTWNPDRRLLPPGPVAGWPAGSIVCPKCGGQRCGIVRPAFLEVREPHDR